jgi:hypothetical protein
MIGFAGVEGVADALGDASWSIGESVDGFGGDGEDCCCFEERTGECWLDSWWDDFMGDC